MALLGKSKFLSGLFDKGMVADVVKGVGIGTLINVIDKKALGKRLTTAKVSIGQTLNGKPLDLNGTDVLTALATTGISFTGSKLMTMGITLGSKKVFEAFDYIDPPQIGGTGIGTNVTERRMREQMQAQMNTILAQQQTTHSTVPVSTFGGLN